MEIDINSVKDIKEDSIIFFFKEKNKWIAMPLKELVNPFVLKDKELTDKYDSIINYFKLIENENVFKRIESLENDLKRANLKIAFSLLINAIQLGKEEINVDKLLEIYEYIQNPNGDIPHELVKFIGGNDD